VSEPSQVDEALKIARHPNRYSSVEQAWSRAILAEEVLRQRKEITDLDFMLDKTCKWLGTSRQEIREEYGMSDEH
jgi:hypothetical protein